MWSQGQYAPGTPGPPLLVPCFGPCRRGEVTGPSPTPQQQQYPQPPALVPRCCDSPCPPCYLYPQPPIYLIYLHLTISMCKYVSPLGSCQPHSPSLLESSWLPRDTVNFGLATGTSPLPRLAPPIPRRGPRHQQHLGWGDAPKASLGLWLCQGVSSKLLGRRTVRSHRALFSLGTWRTLTRHVPGPDLGPGTPELSVSQPYCQTSSVLSALALDPLILSCPVLHLPQGAEAAVPYSFVLPLLRNLAPSHGPRNPILSSFVA